MNKQTKYLNRLRNAKWHGTSRRHAKHLGKKPQGRILVPLEQYFGKIR